MLVIKSNNCLLLETMVFLEVVGAWFTNEAVTIRPRTFFGFFCNLDFCTATCTYCLNVPSVFGEIMLLEYFRSSGASCDAYRYVSGNMLRKHTKRFCFDGGCTSNSLCREVM
jgi:hypothetical protein